MVLREEVTMADKLRLLPSPRNLASYTGELLEFPTQSPEEAQQRLRETARRLMEESGTTEAEADVVQARMLADQAARDYRHATAAQQDLAAHLAQAVRQLGDGGRIVPAGPDISAAPEAMKPWPSLVEKFFEDRPSIGASAQTSHRQAFRDLETVIGDKPLGEVIKTDIKAFADYLRDKPVNRAGRTSLSRDTIVKLLQHVRSYFGWATDCGYVAVNPAEGVKPRTATRQERDGTDDRRAFETAELEKLFSSPLFTGCKSPSHRSTPGRMVYRDEKYWFFLLAALTGARIEEVAAMPSALVEVGGVLCINLRDVEVKTGAGKRLIPILPELHKLGLVEWAAEQARRGRGLVTGPNASKDWSKWSNRYLDDIGFDDRKLVTYSLRHTFRQMLRAGDLKDELSDKVFGHEGKSVGARYGRDLSDDEARLIVSKVRSPTPLVHLYPVRVSR
jgi:integrase